MAVTTNPYLSGNCAPVADELTAFDLPVTGTIPVELEGRWLRNGPNPFDEVDPASHHWFIGDGMVHGVRLRGGRAEWYRNRWVRTDRIATALGEPAPGGPDFGHRDFGPNTHVAGFAGRTWALVEAGGTPVELGYELETVARNDFSGTLPGPFSAHPKYDPTSGELHAMCYAWPDLVDHLQYVVVGPDGRVRRTVDIPVPDWVMVHDLSLTGRYAVVYDLPVTIDLDAVTAGSRFPFRWKAERPSRVGLLPRDGEAADIVWVDVDPCFVFHPLNAYDTDDGQVVIDLCRYDKMFDHDVLGPFGDGLATLDRWTIDPVARRVHAERIDDRAHEFPRHDPRVGGRAHRYGYTAGVDPSTPGLFGATYQTDYHTGEVLAHDHGPGRGGAEPVFVPRAGSVAEDDGWLLVTVYDATADTSELVVLDAADLTAAPVGRVHLPRRIPHGFHGSWVPDTSVAPPA
jgi:8'-apo-carotenoid 13,14-cleaving dioxygenase